MYVRQAGGKSEYSGTHSIISTNKRLEVFGSLPIIIIHHGLSDFTQLRTGGARNKTIYNPSLILPVFCMQR